MASIPCVDTIEGVRAALGEVRARGNEIGLVPTMGALHEGHLSLIRAARRENGVVVVSVFVNPIQFGPSEDLHVYPRDLESDRTLAEEAGADFIFSPTVGEMYALDFSTWVEVEGLSTGLCGRVRPGHFRGVCTVVTKLLNICRPERVYFGEKDAQQLAVIRRMVRDLDIPVRIVACPTVRDWDGLALSSRNTRLTREQRAQAPLLFQALSKARDLVGRGERDAEVLDRAIRAVLAQASPAEIEYVEIVRAFDLKPVSLVAGETLIAVAVRFGEIRLVDNVEVTG